MFGKEEKYEVHIKSVTDVNMSNWQITDMLDTLTMVNNKFDVLFNIVNLLNAGVAKQNIFVTNKSFLFSTNYKTYFDKGSVFVDEDIAKMSYIGTLIPMEKNLELENINRLFAYYKKMNSILSRHLRCRLKRRYLTNGYNTLFTKGLDESCRIITSGAKEQVMDAYNRYLSPDYEKRARLLEEIEKQESRLLRKYSNEIKKVSSSSGSKFEYYFDRNERPIVGVYNPEDHSINIINSEQMYKSGEEFNNQIRLKQISKNSPVFLVFSVTGIMLGFLGYLAYREHKVSNDIVEANMLDFPQNSEAAINNIMGSGGEGIIDIGNSDVVDSQIKGLTHKNLRKLEIVTSYRYVSLELKKEE